MPKKKWSKRDEAKYEAILDSCKTSNRRKHKKGAKLAATCKRIAAATVNRDRALSELGLQGGVPAIPGLFAPPSAAMPALRGLSGDELKRYRIVYRDRDPASPAFSTIVKAYDAEDAEERWWERSEDTDWRIDKVELADKPTRLRAIGVPPRGPFRPPMRGLRGGLGAQLIDVRLGR
jgi:hypothetical protein